MGTVRTGLCVLFLVCCAGNSDVGDDAQESDSKAGDRVGPVVAAAPDADITNVYARQEKNGTWTFHVSVRHPDRSYDDFADGWDLVTGAGQVLKVESHHRFTKVVRRPHLKEQPFTRTVKGVVIPESVEKLKVRAHDSRAGFGGKEVLVHLNRRFGNNFSVKRAL